MADTGGQKMTEKCWNCGFRYDPNNNNEFGTICPKCNKDNY